MRNQSLSDGKPQACGEKKELASDEGRVDNKLFMGTACKDMPATPCPIATANQPNQCKKELVNCHLNTNLHNTFILP